jgi:hypothetical protein
MVQWRSVTTSALLWVPKPLRIGTWYPHSFDYTPGSSADTLPIEIFEHRRFVRIERSIKKLITPERNALADDTIKACGCLKVWWIKALLEGNMTSREE